MKAVNPSEPEFPEMISELRNEHVVYLHLASLWGTTIPELLAFGFCPDLGRWVLATEFLDGEHPRPGLMTVPQKVEAVKALKRIHKLGVKHNDVKEPNIVLVGSKVFFIDFAFATVDDCEKNRKAERCLFKKFLTYY